MMKWRESASLISIVKNKINLTETVSKQANYNILCQIRSNKSDFYPNTLVFPGGVLEASDSCNQWIDHFTTFGITNEKYKEFQIPYSLMPPILQNGPDPIKRHVALRITAIRETFEELGVLICIKRSDHNNVSPKQLHASFLDNFDIKYWQNKVHNDSLEFLNLCKYLDCYPDIWSLYLWSNWLTPIRPNSRRFDAVFFLTAFESQPPIHFEKSEVSDCMWSNPETLLKSFDEQNLLLAPPQWYELSRLKYQHDMDKLVAFAASRSNFGCKLFFPIYYPLKNGTVVLLPGDELYPKEPDRINKIDLSSDQLTIEDVNNSCNILHRIIRRGEKMEFLSKNYVPDHYQLLPNNGNIPLLPSNKL